MLSRSIESYLSARRAAGFTLRVTGFNLRSFAAYADALGDRWVKSQTAIDWAAKVASIRQRARRLGDVERLARYLRAEDVRHQIPPKIFGSTSRPRPTPYILSDEQISQLVQLASQSGYQTLRRSTYSTLFALMSCTGLRVSEAIRLRYADLTPDGLMIRDTKFKKSRLVPLHESARAGLERYLHERRPYAPLDDHVFVSLRRKPLLAADVDSAFRTVATRMELPRGRGNRRATPHSLRHAFAVRALKTCPDGRDHITKHLLMLSTYLGHTKAADTYWYLEAVPDLMQCIADRTESHVTGGWL